MIGKPYSGKLNVRFDEAELEIEPSAPTPVPYSTGLTHDWLGGDGIFLFLALAFRFLIRD